MRSRRYRSYTAALGAFAVTAAAFAQSSPPPGDVERARDHFRAGVEAARDGHWPEARLSFSRAYTLVPVPQTLFNLAHAQVETGEILEGLASYQRFLREGATGAAASYRAAAESAVQAAQARVPKVRLDVDGVLQPDDVLLVDHTELPRTVIGDEYPLDPGEHVFRIVRGGTDVVRYAVEVPEGQVLPVLLPAPPAPPRPRRARRHRT